MTDMILFRYTRPDGGIDVSPNEPPEGTPYTTLHRLIADDGMILVNGDIRVSCVDTEEIEGWTEEPEVPESLPDIIEEVAEPIEEVEHD